MSIYVDESVAACVSMLMKTIAMLCRRKRTCVDVADGSRRAR